MKKTAWLFAALLAAGCGGGGGSGLPSNGAVAGSWHRESGGLYSFTGDFVLQYLSLAKDGSGEAFSNNPQNVLGCQPLHVAVIDAHTLTLDDGQSGGGQGGGSTPLMFRFVRSGDTLTLTDAVGNQTIFTRVAAVPASAACIVPTAAATYHPAMQKRGYYDALVYDGSALWYEGSDAQIYPVDPGSGTVGPPMVLTSGYSGIQGFANGGFWAICNCGGNDAFQLRTTAGAKLDAVDFVGLGLTDNFSGDTGAWDGSNLWINAYDYTDQKQHLIRVDPAGAGTVVSDLAADLQIYGMTFRGSNLWAIYSGDRLVEVDPATGQATATVSLPAGSYFSGVGAVGTDLYVIGEDDAYYTIIVKLTGVP